MREFTKLVLGLGMLVAVHANAQSPRLNVVCSATTAQVAKLVIRGPESSSASYQVGFAGDPTVHHGSVSNVEQNSGVTTFSLSWNDERLDLSYTVDVRMAPGQPTGVQGNGVEFVCKQGSDFGPFPAVTFGN